MSTHLAFTSYCSTNPYKAHYHSKDNMSFFRKLTTRKPKPSFINSHPTIMDNNSRSQQRSSIQGSLKQDPPPPPYTAQASNTIKNTNQAPKNADSPYAFLGQFDTIFLIDDSGSMAGRSWRETSAALAAITPICTQQDADGIDIYFLNHRNQYAENGLGGYSNVTTMTSVQEIFHNVAPFGGTPTGTRLNSILKPYITKLEKTLAKGNTTQESEIKPLNIIVITDGVATDDVESTIINAARKLDTMGAEPWQVGVQFFQVGQEPEAAQDLQELDDALSGQHGIRDMVDTVPWSGVDGSVLTAEGIMKVTMGAINRKLDRKRGSDERLRS